MFHGYSPDSADQNGPSQPFTAVLLLTTGLVASAAFSAEFHSLWEVPTSAAVVVDVVVTLWQTNIAIENCNL